MRTKFFSASIKRIHFKYPFEVSWENQEASHLSVLWVFLFLNFKLLLLKFIYRNSVYIALSSVLKGGKSGKQVAKH